jgi:phage gpG-like protein
VITTSLSGGERVLLRLSNMRTNLDDLSVPLMRAGVYARDRAIWRIKQQGGDQQWPATVRGGHIGIDTGRMWQSIGISQSDAASVTVGTNVRYAGWFQRGRGPIVPKKAKFLRFEINGTVYFSRGVGPQPPRPFLLLTDYDRAKIRAIFVRHIMARPEDD